MSHSCRLLCGFLMSCIGWTGIIIATSTNDWVVTCKYGMHTCRKMDELETKGLWTECVISTALYHCISLNQILDIPGEKEFNKSLFSLHAIFYYLFRFRVFFFVQCWEDFLYCSYVSYYMAFLLFSALCGMVSTVWFPIGVLHEDGLMSFGFSLYAGWVGSALCFFGSSVMICCSRGDNPSQNPENHYYYSKHSGVTNSGPPINNHAKSAHV
uniref:Claudin n=1 Tax=Cyprinus carpio TaxID=7962 RepID=A0A8C2C1D6_CYPCA